MFNTLKRMIQSNKYTLEYLEERIETLYLVGRITKEEYDELMSLMEAKELVTGE